MSLGIMQGRLAPPIDGKLQAFPTNGWNTELELCRGLGVECIEWIYDGEDLYFLPNPISTFEGANALSGIQSPRITSLCADYFVKAPLLRVPENIQAQRIARLKWLIFQCELANISCLVLPFVDDNAIRTHTEIDKVVDIFYGIKTFIDGCDVQIALETNLNPRDTAILLDYGLGAFGINYDSGNSASLGYDVEEEWGAYGHRIVNIHIKDRVLNGGSVPLGGGSTNFDTLATMMSKFGYNGNLILQVARGESGKEAEWYQRNRNFLLDRGIGQ